MQRSRCEPSETLAPRARRGRRASSRSAPRRLRADSMISHSQRGAADGGCRCMDRGRRPDDREDGKRSPRPAGVVSTRAASRKAAAGSRSRERQRATRVGGRGGRRCRGPCELYLPLGHREGGRDAVDARPAHSAKISDGILVATKAQLAERHRRRSGSAGSAAASGCRSGRRGLRRRSLASRADWYATRSRVRDRGSAGRNERRTGRDSFGRHERTAARTAAPVARPDRRVDADARPSGCRRRGERCRVGRHPRARSR